MTRLVTMLMNAPYRLQKFVSLAILGAVALVVAMTFVLLTARFVDSLNALEDRRVYLGTLIALSQLGEQSQASTEALRETAAPLVFSGASDAITAASLQTWLQETASANGVEINSISNSGEKSDGSLRKLDLKMNISGELPAIQAMIFEIEKKQPRLFIRHANISSNYSNEIEAEDSTIILTADIEIYALIMDYPDA